MNKYLKLITFITLLLIPMAVEVDSCAGIDFYWEMVQLNQSTYELSLKF